MAKCVFCEIIKGTADGDIVYSDEQVVAFLDIRPIHPGHTLVVPRIHYETLLDIPDNELAHLIQVTKKLANKVMQVMQAEGFRVACNNSFPYRSCVAR
ncbi:MAG: HIT family protein [Candidatus Helarchaeota archaeon]